MWESIIAGKPFLEKFIYAIISFVKLAHIAWLFSDSRNWQGVSGSFVGVVKIDESYRFLLIYPHFDLLQSTLDTRH